MFDLRSYAVRPACLLFASALLASCVAPTPPFAGLDRDSYGPLVNYRDPDTKASITPPLCDPDAKYSDVNEFSRRITAAITSPIEGADQVDPGILQEGLQSKFKMPGDPGGFTVTILRRNKDEIVFWYRAQLVTLPETFAAAQIFCTHHDREVVYEGSAKKCSAPQQMPIAINGKSTMIETYAISGFQCVAVSGTLSAGSGNMTSDPALVRRVQSQLQRLGLLNGVADGSYGPKTRAAIITFQRRKGLPTDGLPTEALANVLDSN